MLLKLSRNELRAAAALPRASLWTLRFSLGFLRRATRVVADSKATANDLMRHLGAPVVLATRTTLGTINHTLLSVFAIREAKLDLRGVVMIGNENLENRRAVEHYGNVPVVGSIPWLEKMDRATLITIFERHFDKTAFGSKTPLLS